MKLFNRGQRVSTHLGAGVVLWRRLKAPEFTEALTYGVFLDSEKDKSNKPPYPTYTGTVVEADKVTEE